MTLCTWQHERGALYIMILTDSHDVLPEEQFLALETLHRSEGSAWLGRDLRQAGTEARLKSNLSAMNRARVWTHSFTIAEHVQSAKLDRCRELGQQRPCRNVTVSVKVVASTRWKVGICWIEKTQSEYRTSSVMGHVYHQGARRQDMTVLTQTL